MAWSSDLVIDTSGTSYDPLPVDILDGHVVAPVNVLDGDYGPHWARRD